MTLPWIPRISYGGVVFDLALPQRPWVPVSRGIGGYEESAAGVPSVWEYRRDEMRRMTIRFVEAEWGEVLAWLIHAQRGGQFGIAPDYRGDSYTCYLVAPRMGEDIEPRPGDFPGVWELDLTIRTVSGAVIPGRYYGITPLIDWSPGQMLSTMHFSRSSPAMYRDRSGVWQETGPNVPRTTWGTDPVTGLLVPRYLTEPAGTNLVPGNRQRFVGWSAYMGAVVTLTQGQTIPGHSPAGAATRIQTTGGTDRVKYYLITGLGSRDGATPEAWSVVVQNLGAATVEVATNGGAATVAVPPGQTVHVRTADSGVGRSGSRSFQFRGAAVGVDLDFVAWAPQLELTPYVTSPILDPAASSPNPTTRSSDSLYVPLPPEIERPGAALAVYARWVHDMDGAGGITSPGVWAITDSSGGTPRIYHGITGSPARLSTQHANGTAFENAATSLLPGVGALVESLSLIWTDTQGRLTGRLIARVLPAGSSQWGPIHAADLPPLEPAPEWSARRFYIGSRGTAPGVYEYEAFRVWSMRNGVWRGSDQELLTRARTSGMGVR